MLSCWSVCACSWLCRGCESITQEDYHEDRGSGYHPGFGSFIESHWFPGSYGGHIGLDQDSSSRLRKPWSFVLIPLFPLQESLPHPQYLSNINHLYHTKDKFSIVSQRFFQIFNLPPSCMLSKITTIVFSLVAMYFLILFWNYFANSQIFVPRSHSWFKTQLCYCLLSNPVRIVLIACVFLHNTHCSPVYFLSLICVIWYSGENRPLSHISHL